MINHGAKWPPVVPHTWYRQAAAIENTCSVAECNSSCVSGYGGGQYSTVFTDPIHSRTNSTLAAKLYKAKKNKGLQMVPGWSPDGTIQRAQHEEAHQILHWARQVHGSCSESSILTVFVWVCSCNQSGRYFFARNLFLDIFSFFYISK